MHESIFNNRNLAFLINNLSNSGGTQRILCILCNLSVDKYNITILVNESGKSFYKLDQRVNVISLSEVWGGILGKNLKIYKIFNEKKIDFYINLDSNSILFNGFILPKKTKLILWEHFSLIGNFNKILFKISRHYAVLKCFKIVVLSQNEMNLWSNYNKLSKNKLFLIYNPLTIDSNLIVSNLSQKKFLAIGNDISVKGFDILLEAWALFKNDDWTLQIVGLSDGDIDKLSQIIYGKKLNNIQMFGRIANIEKFYQNATVFLLPSRKEVTPLVLIESQAFGLPAIVFDHLPGVLELLNESGIVVHFEHKEMGFSAAMNKIANNPEYLKLLSEAALINSIRFNTENFKNSWMEIFDD
ncbi:glycosyltransferase [Acinetobacter sp. ANC 4173]|uniref:glycosyltransferase n=1 Tax=Acinetobacter sp. ANC 4173 TaxID=2529837 RepID=UPI00103C9D0A|nr:glycosyltransferase [Acinetobacter sp. ANC 4173]TCB80445.1 glycosyltransferase family 4 protein [Acinetobacter sp. ANC 4173]